MNRKTWLLLSISLALAGVCGLVYALAVPGQTGEAAVIPTTKTEGISNWPQQGYDPQRSSFNPHEWKLGRSNVGELDLLWSKYEGCTINSSPTVVDGLVYYGDYCGDFRAVNAQTGVTIWSQDINRTETSHAIVNGIVFVSARCTYTTCGMVYAFNAYTGDIYWTWDTGYDCPLNLSVVDGVVYFTLKTTTGTFELKALDAITGDEIWHVSQGGLFAIESGKIYVTSPTLMVVLEAASGGYLWSGTLEGERFSRPAVSESYVYISSDNGKLYVFDSSGCGQQTCSPLWIGLAPGLIKDGPQSPAIAYGKVFFGAGDTFYGFDAHGCADFVCAPLWSTKTVCAYFPGKTTPPSVGNGVVYSPCGANYLYAFDESTGENLWQYYTSGGYPMRASPAIADGRLYHAATFNYRIFAFEPPFTGVFLYPDSQTRNAIPGESLLYELALQNNSGDSDRFRLDYSGNQWPTMLSITETPTMINRSLITFTISVEVPDGLPWYMTDTVMVTATSVVSPSVYPITAQVTSRIFAPSQLHVSPVSISSTQTINQLYTQDLIIQNGNGVTLTFDLSASFEKTALLLHLDEPAGSITFIDSSGLTNHGFCTEPNCPLSGIPGRYGTALQFDGLDDYIQHPELIKGLPEGTINLWFKVNSWDPGDVGIYFWSGTRYLPNSSDSGDLINLGSHQDGRILFGINANGWKRAESNVVPIPGVWYHLAGSWGPDGINLYINGELKGSNPYIGGVSAGINYNLIGSSSYPGTVIDGVIDEVSIRQRALSALEIKNIYLRGAKKHWLSVEPISGIVPSNSALAIQASLEAADLQPDIYTSDLFIENSDPLKPVVQIPVTMMVEPTADMGWVEGTITDLRSGEPLEAGITVAGQPYLVTSDRDSGFYRLWLEPGSYELLVDLLGYEPQAVSVEITGNHGATQDIALLQAVPSIHVVPDLISTTQKTGTISNHTLNISNPGSGTLTFNIHSPSVDPTGMVLWMHFDELAGESQFIDSSGYGNHGFCEEDNCPHSGADGYMAAALQFDGLDDSVKVLDAPSLNPQEEISISAWINLVDGDTTDACLLYKDRQYELRCESRVLKFDLYGIGAIYTAVPSPGTWRHIAAIYDGSVMQFWVDGELKVERAAVGSIHEAGYPLEIGVSRFGYHQGGHFQGRLDEVRIFTRALEPQEIRILSREKETIQVNNQLIVEPLSGSVVPDSSLSLQITLDATDTQPGSYLQILGIRSNDPANPWVQIPVTMAVSPIPGMGWVEGTVKDLRTGEPLEAILTATGQPDSVISNPQNGSYNFWLMPGSYELSVSAPGYIAQNQTVRIYGSHATTQNFVLKSNSPWMSIDPDSFSIMQIAGTVATHTLTISNTGNSLLTFAIHPELTDAIKPWVMFHLDEPAGSTSFIDSSGHGFNAVCEGGRCPIAGVDGIQGTALAFDGLDDFLEIIRPPDSESRWFGGPFSISVWLKNHNLSAQNSRIIEFGGVGCAGMDCFWFEDVVFSFLADTGRMALELGGLSWYSYSEIETDQVFPEDEWVHVVATVDEGGTGAIYWNGDLVASDLIDLPTNSSYYYYIGAQGWDRRHFFDGLIDEFILFERALTAGEIQLLAHGIGEQSDWLGAEPLTGTIPVGGATPIQVSIDTHGLPQATYSHSIPIASNDPRNPLVVLPVNLTVVEPGENKIYFPLIISASTLIQPETSSTWGDMLLMFSGLSGLVLLGWLRRATH
ncbi:LamG-like jellyroll fold domain-containing protein [Chloroflexota bacterium]